MALAEARAAWQRTANRYLVQEDAKQVDTEPTSAAYGRDIPSSCLLPFNNHDPSHSNLFPNTRWWLQLQPNYGYQKVLIDEQLNFENIESCCNEDNPYKNFATCENKANEFGEFCPQNFQETLNLGVKERVGEIRNEIFLGCEVSKNANGNYFDSESSWIRAGKNTPWWRTANTEELAFLVAQSSSEFLENCDLPNPHNHLKTDSNASISCFSSNKIFKSSSLDWKPGTRCHDHFSAQIYKPGRSSLGSACPKLRVKAEDQLIASTDKQLSPINERMAGAHTFDTDASKAKLLEALRHSQTRAREAEKAAKQASQEKEHIIKLVFIQASQLFAYKQWFQLLQLENMYYQLKENTSPQKTRKIQKSCQKFLNRKRVKRAHPWYDVSKYAIVFALGLSLVGAGLILGWSVGWMCQNTDNEEQENSS